MSDIPAPQKLTLTLSLPNTDFSNEYPLWIYPAKIPLTPPSGVKVTRSFAEARAELDRCGNVVLIPAPENVQKNESIDGAFATDFWCYPMFRRYNPPGTMGILCDPAHPALAGFPTSFHSDWQWWRLTKNSRTLKLGKLPNELRPIVQVIDSFSRNQKLGLLWEVKVGSGKLLVCSADLPGQQEAPEVRQFTRSLLDYAGSPQFDPKISVESKTLEEIFTN